MSWPDGVQVSGPNEWKEVLPFSLDSHGTEEASIPTCQVDTRLQWSLCLGKIIERTERTDWLNTVTLGAQATWAQCAGETAR